MLCAHCVKNSRLFGTLFETSDSLMVMMVEIGQGEKVKVTNRYIYSIVSEKGSVDDLLVLSIEGLTMMSGMNGSRVEFLGKLASTFKQF